MSGGSSIKVVVRCRPLNARELKRGAKGLIRMEGTHAILSPPEAAAGGSGKATTKGPQVFSFDKSYWSAGSREDPDYASQQTLYDDLGVELLDHSFEGFNTCIFAYGQTGSGKSYSMMGYGADKGIIPLTTSELFRRVEERSSKDAGVSYTVEVSYIEIYNEKVRDLLNPKNKGNLRVREHPSLGPYVEDLSRLVVENYGQMMTLMDEGNKARTVASTNMNETSSRSHAVFTLILTQKRLDAATNMTGEKVSKISLVDLAGSERQASTGATGQRLKEGANINKSLTTLGKVIAALAQASAPSINGKKKKDDFVPYRDSVLTWLLKESLGGNSKTAMIAAISPADYEETLSTLRYADAAKKIKTHAVVNEDPNAKLIRELKEELDLLRSRVAAGGSEATYDPDVPPERQVVTYKTKEGEIKTVTKLELQDQLQASEKLMESLNLTWEEKMQKTQAIHVEREKALEELGIMVDKGMVGVHAPQKHPSLVNLNEDPLMSECLLYQLKPGTTIAGSSEETKAHIKLSGSHILSEHCIFTNSNGEVSIEAMENARTFVNGKRVPPRTSIKLLNGFRVILGDMHVFRFNDPAAVRAQRQKMAGAASMGDLAGVISCDGTPMTRSDSIRGEAELMDWSAARREVADIEKLGDQDLEKLFDDIVKVRTQRKLPDHKVDSEEVESRIVPSLTEDSLVDNPWHAAGNRTSIGTPFAPGPEPDVALADERSEADTAHLPPSSRPSGLGEVYDSKAEDAAMHQQHLTKQLRSLAGEVRRMKRQAAARRALESTSFEPEDWTPRELRLAQGAVEKWKRLRTFAMAEQILKEAVNVREANVIPKQIGRPVSYNFLVVHGSTASPSSSLDNLNGIVEFEDVSHGAAASGSPCVVVKVIDREANAVYTWDLVRFHQQLARMRHTAALLQKPNYSQHFSTENIFTEVPPPSFSFVGAAKAPLRLLASSVPCTVTVPILCPYTMEAIGSCRVSFKLSSDLSFGTSTPRLGDGPSVAPLSPGSRFSFTITVEAVKGLSSDDFVSVHAQTRLSSLVGPSIASEDTFASLPIDLARTSVAHLQLRKSISINVTPEIIKYFTESYATIEFFAKVHPRYLDRLERWDLHRESLATPPTALASPMKSNGTPERPVMRRNETDFVSSEHHDVLVKIDISEMSADGEYVMSEVVDDVFQLHQGLQRRLSITLVNSSGRSLPWTSISHVSTSDIRIVEKGGVVSVSKGDVEMRMPAPIKTDTPDGKWTMSSTGTWDSAAHYCGHLNKRTPSDGKVLVRLVFLVDVETLDEPSVFSLDIALRILGRDQKRRSIMTFWSPSKIFTETSTIFSVDLAPPLALTGAELWRLNTSYKHVPGQEILGDWRPRGLSLLDDFKRLCHTERAMADVGATKAVLELREGDVSPVKATETSREELLRRCVMLWKLEMEHRVTVDVSRASIEEEAIAKKVKHLLPDLQPRLVPTVKIQPVSGDNVVRGGPLLLLRDSQLNQWEKFHFVLRRPYLFLHPSPTERESQIINLSSAKVVPSPDVEMLLERQNAFTIFTPTNSYILQAATRRDMTEWISVIATTAEP